MLTHFSLFTGIGGADIAAEWAGFETIGQVEWADYPTKVLEKHWPNVPRWRDIRDVSTDNVRNVIGQQHITVLSGGFPCQPFSVAGKRKGKDDDRFLWPEMLRVISELKPTWVIGENVNGFVNMGLEDACADLENQGYEVQPFVIPACAVQAPHQRNRVFIVGYVPNSERIRYKRIKRLPQNIVEIDKWRERSFRSTPKLFDDIDWKKRAIESGFLGGNNGIPSRVDRLKCLGNAIVPQQIYPIFKAIADIENNK